MPLIQYKVWRPTDDVLQVVHQANEIIDELQQEGYTLTLRQLYYQFIGRGLFTENTERQYKRLGRIVTDAREGGFMDWDAIEDRGRSCYFNNYNDDPLKLLKRIEYGLGRDPWQDQEVYLECWIEKQSLEPVLARPCQKRRAPYMACKGYLSASEAYRAGLRFQRAIAKGKRPILIHLGDHDPSGMDMTRDNGERLEMFARYGVEVVRVALNMDQVKQFNPPPMPSKTQDSREKSYRALHGGSSWELDALQPRVITQLILDAIDQHIDTKVWEESMEAERKMREESGLSFFADRYEELRMLATSPEKPLERLAALSALVEEVRDSLHELGSATVTLPGRITDLLRPPLQDGVKGISHTQLPFSGTKEAKEAFCEGFGFAKDLVTPMTNLTTPEELPDMREKRTTAYSLADQLERANTPIPFERVEPAEEEDPNTLDLEDPDAEDQDYGLGPVRGE
jgi:hypothetical protein